MRTRFQISLDSHVDSQPEMRRENQRQCCAGLTPGKSSPPTAEPQRSSEPNRGSHDQNPRLRVMPTLVKLRHCLSHLVRATETTSAVASALSTTTTDHFGCSYPLRLRHPRTADKRHAPLTIARRLHASPGRCTTEGLGNRRWLPTPHHPSPSRSHEEGNVDQRIATGGMPHRDR